MPTLTPKKSGNPIFDRIASDGLFGTPFGAGQVAPGPTLGQRNVLNNAGIYEAGSHGAINAAANSTGIFSPKADSTPLPTGREGMNIATGNIFGAPLSIAARSAVSSAPMPVQVAGELEGLGQMGALADYQTRLSDAGINLNPVGQTPGDFKNSLTGAQGIYNNVFAPPGSTPPNGGSVTAYAPSGLRDQTIAAGGQGVWGQGDVMSFYDGMNKAGGRAFSLGQVLPVGGPNAVAMNPANPIAPAQKGLSRLPASSTPYQQNAQAFKDNAVTQQMQAGLIKSMPPGYMLDPNKPNAIMPIPGGPAEVKLAEDKKAAAESDRAIQEAGRQSLEKAGIVTKTINQILPQLNSMTTGVAAALTESVPGTPAYNVGKLKDTVVANIGLKELKAMKEASKTGASGMGALSEKELAVLETSLGNLNLAQDTKQVAKAMKDVRNSFYRWRATYKAGQLGDTPDAMLRQNAVKWALSHESDPRAEKILAMDDK